MIYAPQIFADGIPASGEITYSEYALSIRAEGTAARVDV